MTEQPITMRKDACWAPGPFWTLTEMKGLSHTESQAVVHRLSPFILVTTLTEPVQYLIYRITFQHC